MQRSVLSFDYEQPRQWHTDAYFQQFRLEKVSKVVNFLETHDVRRLRYNLEHEPWGAIRPPSETTFFG